MGAASSRIEDDKALLLCRERRRFVRQALDGRCSLADAHVSYIEALRNTGVALGKFFEPNVPIESSLQSSISATPEPLVLNEKSVSQLSVSSPSLHVMESYLSSSSPSGSRINVNHMISGQNGTRTIEECPPVSLTATIHSADSSPNPSPRVNGTSTFNGSTTMAPETPPWDYFGLFHRIDDQFSYRDDKVMSHDSENGGTVRKLREMDGLPQKEIKHDVLLREADDTCRLEIDDIQRLREVEGIPELEEVGRSSLNGKSDLSESEDDFDQPSPKPLVRIFKNRTEGMDLNSIDVSSAAIPAISPSKEINEDITNSVATTGEREKDTACSTTAVRATSVSSARVFETSELEKGTGFENNVAAKDFVSNIREIKELFIKAYESGKQVPRMLEADKVSFRPIIVEAKVHKSNGSILFMAFHCCRDETYSHEETTTTNIKYLTWHRSVSSLSSSSQNLLESAPESGADLFSSACMNSGSHASTLDRLYAWEKKLYDEVKASGIVRKEYDIKCKLLRQQESKCENSNKTDGARVKVKDSYSSVRVAIHRINSISKKIEELRDKELQPQLEELVEGLSRMWASMMECHRRQVDIISMTCNTGIARMSTQSEYLSQAATVLEHELNFLCSSFPKWISAQRSYLQAINEWLLKCAPLVPTDKRQRKSVKKQDQFCPKKLLAPPIYITCQEWLKGLDKLPTSQVVEALKNLAEEMVCFLPQKEKHGSTNPAGLLSRRFSSKKMLSQEVFTHGAPSDRNPGIEGMWSRLDTFLKSLYAFSEESTRIYSVLGVAIQDAKSQYSSGRRRVEREEMMEQGI